MIKMLENIRKCQTIFKKMLKTARNHWKMKEHARKYQKTLENARKYQKMLKHVRKQCIVQTKVFNK